MRHHLLNVIFIFCFASWLYSQPDAQGIKRMFCAADTSQRYALYLPAAYDYGKQYPLLLFFDPGARGSFPLEKYRVLADKYHFIFAGSMNSKNFDGNSSVASFVAMYNDITDRYLIDTGMIWLSGFSGGARAVNSIAAGYAEVKGVIACGAGFAGNVSLDLQRKYSLATLVGNGDMNFGEISDISNYFQQSPEQHLMLVFTGGHAWPPVNYFDAALLWASQQSGIDMKDSAFVDRDIIQRINLLIDSGFVFEAGRQLKQLKQIPAYQQAADSLTARIPVSKASLKDEKNYYQVLADERIYMDSFSTLMNEVMSAQTPIVKASMWQDKVDQITEWKNSKDHYRRLAGLRCIDYSWRAGAEYYYRLMDIKQFDKAYACAELMNLFTTSWNAEFLLARAASALDDKKLAAKHLRTGVKKGMKSSAQILGDGYLQQQFSTEELQEFF